jgi:toxin ParE1/3/4
MAEVIWTEKASAQLKLIFDYIAEDSAIYAGNFIKALVLSTRKLEEFHVCGRVFPEFIGTSLALREVIYRGYRIIYQLEGANVMIVSVMNGRQDLEGKTDDGFI